MTRRTDRLNALLREEISELVSREMKDPRLTGLVSITRVDVSPDLHHARVLVSILGEDENDERDVLKALHSAAPFLRRELTHRLTMRYIPELSFRRDDSIRRGAEVLALIQDIESGEERQP